MSSPVHPSVSLLGAVALAAALALAGCGKKAESPEALIASGKEFVEKKDHKAAVIQFKNAVQADPGSAQARLLLGQALLASGDAVGAVLELTKAADAQVPPAEVVPDLSTALLQAGELKKLVTTYGDTVIEGKAGQATLKTNVATAWAMLGDAARSQQALAAALAAEPLYAPAQLLQARTLAGQGKYAEALALVDTIGARDEKFAPAWVMRGDLLNYSAKPDLAAAEEAYRKGLAADKTEVAAYTGLVTVHLRKRDLAGAKKVADELRAALPEHPQALLIGAQINFLDGQLQPARDQVQQLLRVFPDHAGVLVLAGNIEVGMGSVVQGEAFFAKAVQLNPKMDMARIGQAEADIRLGQHSKALEVLKPLITADPPNMQALALAGDAQLRLGDAEAAEQLYKRAIRIDPANVRLQTVSALARMGRGDGGAMAELEQISGKSNDTYADEAMFAARLKRRDYDGALAALAAMDKKRPGQAAIPDLRGRVHQARKDYPAARAAFEEALKIDPGLLSAVNSLAALDIEEKKPEQAVQRLEAAVKANPRNTYAVLALADLKAKQGAGVEDVRRLLAEAVKSAPNNAEARLKLIEFLLRKRLLKDALVAGQDAVSAMPGDARVLDAVGQVQTSAGEVEQALTTYRKLAAAEPTSARPYLRLAEVYQASGKRDQAEAAINRALELEPSLPAAQAAMVDLLVASGKPRNAQEYIARIKQARPDQPLTYLIEAQFHLRARAFEPAIAAYREGLAKTKGSTDLASGLYNLLQQLGRGAEGDKFAAGWLKQNPGDANFEYQVGMNHLARNELGPAEQRLRSALESLPRNALILNNLAYVLAAGGKPGAVDYAQRAVELQPDQPALMDTLAFALAGEKQFDAAMTVQKQALEIAPENNDLRLGLAKVAAMKGDKELARKELRRLQELGTAFARQDEVTRLLRTL